MIVKRQGDRFVMDLVDKATGVAIHNVQSWQDEDGFRRAVIPLEDLWVYSSMRASSEPTTRQLFDGRTIVQFQEDDGSVRRLVIDDQGISAPLRPEDAPTAAFQDEPPSVGVGIRRESQVGPHLGRGYGNKLELKGDIDKDREGVVLILKRLIEQVEHGGIDDILRPA